MFSISKVDFVRPASTRGYQQSTVVICREYTSGRYMYCGLHFSAVPLYSLSKIRIQLELDAHQQHIHIRKASTILNKRSN